LVVHAKHLKKLKINLVRVGLHNTHYLSHREPVFGRRCCRERFRNISTRNRSNRSKDKQPSVTGSQTSVHTCLKSCKYVLFYVDMYRFISLQLLNLLTVEDELIRSNVTVLARNGNSASYIKFTENLLRNSILNFAIMFRQSLGITLKDEFTQVFRKGVWQIKGNLYPLQTVDLLTYHP